MTVRSSVGFFDSQFQRQLRDGDLQLNPFERLALPYLQGRVVDYGCGLGNLALAAARCGCVVFALDASATAIEHLQLRAQAEALPIEARQADLRDYQLQAQVDAVVCIGLLMFFDGHSARRQLDQLQQQVRAGGVAVINVLVEGTTYLDMFDPGGHCLFPRGEIEQRFAGWDVLQHRFDDFAVAGGQVKCFETLVARRPAS